LCVFFACRNLFPIVVVVVVGNGDGRQALF
jgi:hypothetical protein